MLFNQLKPNDSVYIIEVIGTFKRSTEYNIGSITEVSNIYDEPLQPGQFQMPNQPRKKLVDITIACNGENKKFTVPESRSTITDTQLGLTISTDKQEIINIVQNQYNQYKTKIESINKYEQEMKKCQDLLNKLDTPKPTEDSKIKVLTEEIEALKNIIQQNNLQPKQKLQYNTQNTDIKAN